MDKMFDLNIEKILEDWEIYHAIREIIANAIDEQVITNSKDIEIFKDSDENWHIRDYGRGIQYYHLTQNENLEKLSNDNLIGKFGVGLKDALATLFRKNIDVVIKSKYGIITLENMRKYGFEDIITLHAKITTHDDINFIGTDFCISGCSDSDINLAKSLFLKFSGEKLLEATTYGNILQKQNDTSYIYINGVKVAEEPNFLFSYNITSLTKQIKKALNRERTNVGRTAYADRIRSILLNVNSDIVIQSLINDFRQYNNGLSHEELLWRDVSVFVAKMINKNETNNIFITTKDLLENPSIVDEMRLRGYQTLISSENIVNKIEEINVEVDDIEKIPTINTFILNLSKNRVYNFISPSLLNFQERKVFNKTDKILKLAGGRPENVKDIKISETIYSSEYFCETVGYWEPLDGYIIIKRSQLNSLNEYAGTLIHELIHAKSGYGDVSREFESALTRIIGDIVKKAID